MYPVWGEKYLEQFRLRTSDAFPAAFDQDFVVLELFTSLAFTVFWRLTWECDLDRVFFLQANGILSSLADQGSMVLAGNLEDLGRLVGLRTIISRLCKSFHTLHSRDVRFEPRSSF